VCRLCSCGAGPLPGDVLLAGPGLTAHHFCLLFSSGLGQQGAEGEGLRGFLLQDVRREAKRGARLKCVYCRKKGATGEPLLLVLSSTYRPQSAARSPPARKATT
jgi:hypothetical protein